jgi:hypothetical protein
MKKHLVNTKKNRIFVNRKTITISMPKRKNIALDFEIDKLTNSIENTLTGESHPTSVLPITADDLAKIKADKTWHFDWNKEHRRQNIQVYKLTAEHEPQIIQGLISIEVKPDHLYLPLIESAKFNQGKSKKYFGVPGNLVAYACKISFEKGFQGYVSFTAKTKLIEHYQETLGAYHFANQRMIIRTHPAQILINKYYNS